MENLKIAIIGGSGFDDPKLIDNYKIVNIETPFGKPASDLVTGKIGNIDIVVLARHGKNHSVIPTHVPYRANIWALKEIGCTHILATTACGSLREKIKPKEIVFIDQFIDFTKLRNLTFFEDKVIHTPMVEPFCHTLRKGLIETAKELKINYHSKATIVTIEGPRFSTKAESYMFRKLGADVINMSTVPEVILARELGICYSTIAMATDYDCWKKGEEPVTFEMVIEVMKHNTKNVKKLLLKFIPTINHYNCQCRNNQ